MMAGADVARATRDQVQLAADAPSNGQPTVRELISKQKAVIREALPAHLDTERFARIAMTTLRTNTKLTECDPYSFVAALMVSAQLGLEPGGPLGRAYLVPYGNQVQFILGYKGIIELARRSGQLMSIEAHEVCENDDFSYSYGLDDHLSHTPSLKEDRGKAYAYYAVAQFRDGGNVFEVLSRDDVEARRKRGQDGPAWKSDYDAMGRKSAVIALKPWLPMSPELGRALGADNRTFTTIEPNMVDQPVEEPYGELGDGGDDPEEDAVVES